MKLSFKEKIGYGVGDFACNLVFSTLMLYLMFFYTDVFGIPAAVVGTLMLVVSVWDAVSDPLMGGIADRTTTRWGKFRPYLLWLAVPFAVSTALAFTTPPFSVSGKIVYAYITYFLLMTVFTAINVPYSALSGVMTDDSIERTGLNAYRMGFSQFGNLLVGAGTLPLVALLGSGDQALGYQLTMVIFGIIALVFFIVCFSTTRERISPPEGQKTSLKADLQMLMMNRPWQVIFIVGILSFIFIILRTSVVMYYFNYFVESQRLIPFFMASTSISAIIGVTFSKPMVKKIGKKWTFALGQLVSAATVIFFFLPKTAIFSMFAVNVIYGMASFMTIPITWAMIADTADYSEWKFKIRSTGIVFSAATFAHKLGIGIGGGLGGWLLFFFGYIPGVSQTNTAVVGIKSMMSIIPAIGAIIVACLIIFYKIDENMCNKIREDLAKQRTAGKE